MVNTLDATLWSETYNLTMPLRIPIANGGSLVCDEVVRAMPGRRYVCRGIYDNKPVFIKLFSKSSKARREWKTEQQGIQALASANIHAPVIVYVEEFPNLSSTIIVYKELLGAESARHRWQQGNETAREMLMMQLVEVIAQHHAAGLRQTDCHLLNFVFSEDVLYTLDAADVVKMPAALSRETSMQGLVDLLALFPVDKDKLLPSLYEYYCQLRTQATDKIELKKLKDNIVKIRDHKLRKYLDKTYRNCSAFSVKKTWNRFSSILREENNQAMQLLVNNPDANSSDIQRNVIKNGNTCTVTLIQILEQNIVCKRYNIKNVWHGLMRALRISRASHSWRNAHRLKALGIATPSPIALVENRFSFVRSSAWFFMQHIDGTNAYHAFRDGEYNPQQLADAVKQFVGLFETMLQARLTHGDMKITNFIFSDKTLYVIDLDSMVQHDNADAFTRAFNKDMARFMRNWSELPDIASMFDEAISASLVRDFLPVSIKS